MAGDAAERHFRGTKRFRLDSLLGCGATGAVYAAYDRELRTRVALKLLTRWHANSIAAFKQEFRSLQGIRHRNLVELRELIFENGCWFLAMELVRGVDFLSFVRGSGANASVITRSWVEAAPGDETARTGARPGEPEDRVSVPMKSADSERFRAALGQLSEGLEHLHAARRIHRDIKPSNVLVDEHGRVVIVDFGLAAATDQERPSTSDFFGTPRYMSPEQAAGRPLGPASDWFNVGVLMFEALTGRTPERDAEGRVLPSAYRSLCDEEASDLNELCTRLLADSPDLRSNGKEVLSRLALPSASLLDISPVGQRFDDESTFVGRAHELQVLDAALHEVQRGKGVTVVVEGESGVGKTSLLRAFVARARAAEPTLRCFSGRCFEGESLPYKAMDAVIEAVYADLHIDRDLAPLLERDAALVGQAFPSLLRFVAPFGHVQEQGFSAHATPRQQRERVFAALRELFVALATNSTLVIVLDDMQWTDKDSLALLSALSEPPAPPRMLVIVAKRPGGQELSLPLPATALSLGNLCEDDSDSLLRTLLPPLDASDDLGRIRELTREAHGHPLFLLELVRQAHRVGPNGATPLRLDDALWQRIDSLSEPARLLLELSSVAGRPLTQGAVADAAQLSSVESPDGGVAMQSPDALLRELRHARLVRTSGPLPGDAVEPYHDRIREAVVARLGTIARKGHHRNLAHALMRSGSPDAEALAGHWREAGDLETAREYAIRAARQAQSALAFDRAARLFRLSLELGPLDEAGQRELQHALGEALVSAGRGAEAAEAYRAAGDGDDSLLGLHRQRLAAEHLLRSGHIESGALAMSEALRKLGLSVPRRPSAALVSLLMLRVRIELRDLHYDKRSANDVSALESARIDGLWTAATCLTMFDNVRSAELQSRGILRALEAGSSLQVLRAHTAESIFVGTSGAPRAQRLAQILSAATRLATELDDPYAWGWVGLSRGATSFLLGNWQEGQEQCGLAESIFQTRAGAAWELGSAKAFGTWSAMMRGSFGEVSARVPAHVAEAESRGDLYAATLHMTGFSNAAWLAADDVAQAQHMLSLAERRWPGKQFDVPRYLHMIAGAYIALYERHGSVAYARVLQDWRRLRWGIAFRAQITRFGMRTVRGLSAVAAFDETRDPSLLRDASACAQAIAKEGVTWSQCFAHMIQAGVAWRRGRASACVQYLASAEDKADATGMLLHRAVLRLRRGEVIGGATGHALVEDGRAFMAREGIVRIDSMAALLTPTFPC